VILFGYLALALVLSVGSALLAFVVSQASSDVRLFMRCLRWGVATGAVTGAVVGACLPLIGSLRGDTGSLLGFMFGGVVYGAVIGAVVALIPTLIGASVVTVRLRQRPPHPSSEESVHSDLTSVFGVVIAVLHAILLVVMIASGPGLSSAAIALSLIVVGNACVVLMLWRARRSIGRLWFTAAG
jgi:hypothetical protein